MSEQIEDFDRLLNKGITPFEICRILDIKRDTYKEMLMKYAAWLEAKRVEKEHIYQTNKIILKLVEAGIYKICSKLQQDPENKKYLAEYEELKTIYSKSTVYEKIDYDGKIASKYPHVSISMLNGHQSTSLPGSDDTIGQSN